MTSHEDVRAELTKQLEIPQLLVGDRNLTIVHAEVTGIAAEKTRALGPAQAKISECNKELEEQKAAAAKKVKDIKAQKLALKDAEKELVAMDRAIAAKEDGQLSFLEVELGNTNMAAAQAEENVKIVVRLQDKSRDPLLTVVDGAFQLSQEVLTIRNREELDLYGQALMARNRGARSVRAIIYLLVENGILDSKDWKNTFAVKPPDGYAKSEWNFRYPNGELVGRRNWDFDEALDRLGDIIGLPKAPPGSPSHLVRYEKQRKRPFEDYEDDNTTIATDRSSVSKAKKARLSLDIHSPDLTKEDLEAHLEEAKLELEQRKKASG